MVENRNLHEILLRILYTLGDCCSDLIGLTETITDNAVLVTHNNNGCKTEVTTTLSNLGHSLDGNKSVLELKVRCLYFLNICICHSLNF